jgi:hypothetical protein
VVERDDPAGVSAVRRAGRGLADNGDRNQSAAGLCTGAFALDVLLQIEETKT